mmetsp:Transcript_4574/g.9627  ORF Transcript_4574/g.9627 Transcript_4574/m.9627 type:complete len:281 (-) Transcript_4574:712-1554(-)
MKRYCCSKFLGVWNLLETSILTGSTRDARCSFCTLLVMVALKSMVFLPPAASGMTDRILSSSSSKSMDNIRSASSRMRYRTDRRLKPLVFSRWSTSRPGVATTMCGRFARATAWDTMSTPPTTQTVEHPTELPSAFTTSWIWKASSRVGARMTAKSRCGLLRRAWRMGRANAPVLPLPVSARPMTSRPASECGSELAWIAVAHFHPIFSQASHRGGTTPSDSKVLSERTEEVFSQSSSLPPLSPPSPPFGVSAPAAVDDFFGASRAPASVFGFFVTHGAF